MQKVPFPPEFVDQLARLLYTPERVERAAAYARTRGLDPTLFRIPWAMTDADPRPWEFLRRWGQPPSLYTECLFIPVPELRFDPDVVGKPVLAGFDIRYCGPRVDRAKYTKLKRDASSVMLYNVHEAIRSNWVVLNESAIDIETLRMAQIPAVGALTALGSPQFAMLLHGLFERVYIMYDNDKGGAAATRKMLQAAEDAGPAVKAAFQPIVYSGGDPNEALQVLGLDMLRRTVLSQVG